MSGESISIEIKGLAELRRRLQQLPYALQAKVTRGMVATGAAVFRKEAMLRAPYYTGAVQNGHPPPGTLQRAIYQARLTSECVNGREVWRVSAHKGKTGKPDAFYATWVEYGTVKMSPRPYMRPAFESMKGAAAESMRAYLADYLPDAIASLT